MNSAVIRRRLRWAFWLLLVVGVGSLVSLSWWGQDHTVALANCENTIYYSKNLVQCDALVNAQSQVDLEFIPGTLLGVSGAVGVGVARLMLRADRNS